MRWGRGGCIIDCYSVQKVNFLQKACVAVVDFLYLVFIAEKVLPWFLKGQASSRLHVQNMIFVELKIMPRYNIMFSCQLNKYRKFDVLSCYMQHINSAI